MIRVAATMPNMINSAQAFHLRIHDGAHNAVIADFTAGLRKRLAPYRRARLRTVGWLPRSQAEHEAVVRAILTGDAPGGQQVFTGRRRRADPPVST